MNIDLATVVLGWDKALVTLDHLLSKAVDEACAGRSEADVLEWRLAPDMFTLRQQAQAVCNLVGQWAARAAGLEAPPNFTGEGDVSELRAMISKTRQLLSGLAPAQFEARDEVPVTVDLGELEPTMPIGQWVAGFATTNILFHLSMAYAILRSRGVPLGKRDLFAGGL